jgi:N-acetylglucosaminyl-diphospho-decaprenol L-rhamnosyltransferase
MEIIVVDNASVDGTPEKLWENHPHVILHENSENLGHPRAVNIGLNIACGETIMVVDADTEFRESTVCKMMVFLDDHPDVSMAAPRIFNLDGTIQESARNFPTVISGIFGRQSLLSRWFPNSRFLRSYLARENIKAETPFRVDFISAACMLFRRSVLTAIGKWDEGFTGYWVDADWCMRFKKQDLLIYCVPEATIIHHEQNKPFRKKSPKRILNFHIGALRLYRLYYTLGYFDPRYVIAALLLSIRAILLITINQLFLSDQSKAKDPLSIHKSE